MRKRIKFDNWDALADAAGKLRQELKAGAAQLQSDEEWQELLKSTSLAGVLSSFPGR